MLDRGNSVIQIIGESDFLGEMTPFRMLVSHMVTNTVNSGRWFSFGNVLDQRQVNLVRLANKDGKKLGDLLPEYLFESNEYRTRLYKYMLCDYMCYCESPTVRKTADFGYKSGFNKMIITSSPTAIANWMGISYEDAANMYANYVEHEDTGESLYPYVKLIKKDGENKISKPRTKLDLDQGGLRVIPMFALSTGLDVLYSKLKEDIYTVSFLKDSGQVRDMCTSFNKEKVLSLYAGYEDFVESNFEKIYDGDFYSNSTIDRGYVRVFEVGSSVYNNPTRSINYGRIISFERSEADMSFMLIDLDNALETFIGCLHTREWSLADIKELVSYFKTFEVGSEQTLNGAELSSVSSIETWANLQNVALSTVFQRQLALCMIANPHLFNGYTGSPEVLNQIKVNAEKAAPVDLDFGY